MNDTPHGTVTYSILKADLSPEALAHKRALEAAILPRIEFMKGLREALGLSQMGFIDWLLKDEFVGLPPEVPRRSVSITKLLDLVTEKRGSLTLCLTLDGVTTEVSYPLKPKPPS